MKLLSSIILLVFIVFLGLPYVQIYRLDNALNSSNLSDLNRMIDLQSIRVVHEKSLESSVQNIVGTEKDTLSSWMQQGAKMLSQAAVEAVIDVQWVKDEIHDKTKGATILSSMSFAFFESPTRFMIRIGEMHENPLHIEMTLQDWTWRVTALYT